MRSLQKEVARFKGLLRRNVDVLSRGDVIIAAHVIDAATTNDPYQAQSSYFAAKMEMNLQELREVQLGTPPREFK